MIREIKQTTITLWIKIAQAVYVRERYQLIQRDTKLPNAHWPPRSIESINYIWSINRRYKSMCNKAQNVIAVRCNRKIRGTQYFLVRKQHRIMNYLNKEYEPFRVHPFSFGTSRDPRVPWKKERKMDDNAYLLRRRGAFDDVPFAMSPCGLLRCYRGDRPSCFIFVR